MSIIIILLVLLIVLLVSSLYMILATIDKFKHDKVLFGFKSIKGDMVLLLADNINDENKISKEEKIYIRNLIFALNNFCLNYNEVKKKIFNYKVYLYFAKAVVNSKSKNKNKTIQITNQDVKNLGKKFEGQFLDAFYTFIPFMRFRISLLILQCVLYVLLFVGVKTYRDFKKFVGLYNTINDDYHNNHGQLA